MSIQVLDHGYVELIEIRQYANAVGELIKQNFPRTWELFSEQQV